MPMPRNGMRGLAWGLRCPDGILRIDAPSSSIQMGRARSAGFPRYGYAKKLPVDDWRILKSILFLPDGHALLQLVDQVLAGAKRFRAVPCAHEDRDDVLADLECALAMHDLHCIDLKIL